MCPNIIKQVKILGAEQFTGLNDTPTEYTGESGKFVKVDATETRLMFSDALSVEGLVGSWVFLAGGAQVAATQFTTNDTSPAAITSIRLHNTDGAGDKTESLHYLSPGDRISLQATVGNNVNFFNVDAVDETDPQVTVLQVTYDAGSGTQLVPGDSYNLNGPVREKTTLATIIFRGQRSDPQNPVDGEVYYNEITHKLRLYANGAWVDLNP